MTPFCFICFRRFRRYAAVISIRRYGAVVASALRRQRCLMLVYF